MTKFKGAPWNYVFEDSIVYDSDGEIVCDTMSTGEEYEEANAHLISQSPAMYAMLDEIAINMHKTDSGCIEDILAIERLLAKCRGE